MTDASQDLGQRIVQAARLAVAMHLAKAAASEVQPTGRIAIGGAGPRVLTEEHPLPPATGERPRRSRPSPFLHDPEAPAEAA